jgi:perosamine synthetase
MIVTNDKQIYERVMALKDFGREIGVKKQMEKSFSHSTIGYNFKFTEFQAAVGIAQMRKLQKRILKKRKMFRKYVDLLSNVEGIEFLKTNLKNVTPWMIDIFLKSRVKRTQLIKYLEKKQIGTRIYYPPIHRLKPYRKTDREYKQASSFSDRGLWLPSSVTLTDKQIVIICNEIKQFFK